MDASTSSPWAEPLAYRAGWPDGGTGTLTVDEDDLATVARVHGVVSDQALTQPVSTSWLAAARVGQVELLGAEHAVYGRPAVGAGEEQARPVG
jgi:hypothetical protein